MEGKVGWGGMSGVGWEVIKDIIGSAIMPVVAHKMTHTISVGNKGSGSNLRSPPLN